jgi:hypothetical protein
MLPRLTWGEHDHTVCVCVAGGGRVFVVCVCAAIVCDANPRLEAFMISLRLTLQHTVPVCVCVWDCCVCDNYVCMCDAVPNDLGVMISATCHAC